MKSEIDILKQIIFGAEVTVTKIYYDQHPISSTYSYYMEAILNKYRASYQIINYELVRCLMQMEIIEESSGNFETHERHYTINDKFILFKDNIKCIEFGKIEKCILLFNHKYKSISDNNSTNIKIEKFFYELKNKLLRKEKLEKIKLSLNN